MALLKVPDIIIAILVMGIPTAARLAMVNLKILYVASKQ